MHRELDETERKTFLCVAVSAVPPRISPRINHGRERAIVAKWPRFVTLSLNSATACSNATVRMQLVTACRSRTTIRDYYG